MLQYASIGFAACLLWHFAGHIALPELRLRHAEAHVSVVSAPGPRAPSGVPARRFSNQKFAVSLRYPRDYSIEESRTDAAGPEAAGYLARSQPGAVLLATLTQPSATLQLIVNPVVTSEICRSFAEPLDDAYTTGSEKIRGIAFNWRQRGFAAAGTGYADREYAAFWQGNCYEFFLEVVTGTNPDANHATKDPDPEEAMKRLIAIVSSTQITPRRLRVAHRPLPAVDSFTAEWIPHAVLQDVLHVSWEISGAGANEVFLRANCSNDTVLNPLPDGEAPDPYSRAGYLRLESIFSCGSFVPVPPQSGSFRLQVENRSGPVSFTLFVYRREYFTVEAN